jgi:hypothetical protein
MYIFMTQYNINANLTAIITEARSNVGNFSKPGGKRGVTPNTLYTATKFRQLCIYFMIKNRQIIFPKVVYWTPPENAFMNGYFYFYSVVKCGNRALGINERIKKIFSDTKTNPNPPLSRSDRGPSGGPVPKVFRKRAPSGQWRWYLWISKGSMDRC